MRSDAVEVVTVETLSDDWGVLKKSTLRFRRSSGAWQSVTRETYDRGHGAAILLYDAGRRTVVLTRQFRFPVFANGEPGDLIEACAGLLDGDDPATAIRRETEEETGFRIGAPQQVMDVYTSPGSVTERLVLFLAPYTPGDRVGTGGGDAGEGEDIEVLELPFDQALAMIGTGEIRDAKTIILLYHARETVMRDERSS